MNEALVVDVARDGIWTLIVVSGPLLAVSLVVGLVIALFQALTQLQEMTLTFVPKILVMFAMMLVLLPFMMTELIELFLRMADQAVALG